MLHLAAYLVVDNSFLVFLSDYCCDRNRGLPPEETIHVVDEWIGSQMVVLRQFAVDSQVHTTEIVANEFRPIGGKLSEVPGVLPEHSARLQNAVQGQLANMPADEDKVALFRGMTGAPKKLGINLSKLSNEDLSLAALALELSDEGALTYILSADQDLLLYTTWLRARPETKAIHPNCHKIQGLHCLTYMESIHRECSISTDQIVDIVGYAWREQFGREDIRGSDKWQSIGHQLFEIQSHIAASVKAKAEQE